METFSPLSSLPTKAPRGSQTIEKIEKTTYGWLCAHSLRSHGLVESTQRFLDAIGRNRVSLASEAKRIESVSLRFRIQKLPQDEEEKLLMLEGSAPFSMPSMPFSDRALLSGGYAITPPPVRAPGTVPSSVAAGYPTPGGPDPCQVPPRHGEHTPGGMEISQVRGEDRLNPQTLDELDKKASYHAENLQRISQQYEEFVTNPPSVGRKFFAEDWSQPKAVKFKTDKSCFRYPTHGRGLIPPIELESETFMANPGLYGGAANTNGDELEERIQALQAKAQKEEQMMDPHKRQYVKRFKTYLHRKYKGGALPGGENSVFLNTQGSFGSERPNQSRFSYGNSMIGGQTPGGVNHSRSHSRQKGSVTHIRIQNEGAGGQITAFSGSLVDGGCEPAAAGVLENQVALPLYSGKSVTCSIPMAGDAFWEHCKAVFQNMDADGYQIVSRTELLKALHQSDEVQAALGKAAALRGDKVKTVAQILEEIERNGAKRSLITLTELESYFEYFDAVAGSQEGELVTALGGAHSRAFYQVFQSVMDARRSAQQEGALLEPAYQIQQLMEAVDSEKELLPADRRLPQDFPKQDLLAALQALVQCERELTWQELSNNLNSMLSQGNESEGSEEIPRQGRRLAEQATEGSSKVAVAWSVRTFYQNKPKRSTEGLRAVSELASGPESAGPSTKMRSPSGERVVVIKERHQSGEGGRREQKSQSQAAQHSTAATVLMECKSSMRESVPGGKMSETRHMHPPTTSAPDNWEARTDFAVTVPQPYSFAQREKRKGKSIMQQKTEATVELKECLEERELQAQFRAKEVPATNKPGLFAKIMSDNQQRRQEVRQRSAEMTRARERPFDFYIREQQQKEAAGLEAQFEHRSYHDPMAHPQFKANPVPQQQHRKPLTQAMEEDRSEREQRVRERARATLNNASMPPRMELHAQKRKEEQLALSTLSERRGLNQTIFTFKPEKTRKVPDFKEKQRQFREQLEQKKGAFKATEMQPFNFNDKRNVNLWAKAYMDKENDWRDKYPLPRHGSVEHLKPKRNPPSTKKHDAQVALRRKQLEAAKVRQELKEIEEIERQERQIRLAPRVLTSPQLVRNEKLLRERREIKIQEGRAKMRQEEWEYRNSLEQIAKNVENRALLMESQPHNSHNLAQEENYYLVQRITELLRQEGFSGPVTPEVIAQLQNNPEFMRQLYEEAGVEEMEQEEMMPPATE